jgi:hypothetical protein
MAKTIRIEIRGGVAELVGDIPPGVRVELRDFDNSHDPEPEIHEGSDHVEDDPAALLVHAYAKAGDSGSVEWEDINAAHNAARDQLGEARCAEIEALYAEPEDGEHEEGDGDDPACRCDNCGHECPKSELNEAKDLDERLDFPVGDPRCIEPAGECPECGALSYEVEEGSNG